MCEVQVATHSSVSDNECDNVMMTMVVVKMSENESKDE